LVLIRYYKGSGSWRADIIGYYVWCYDKL